MSEEMNNTAVQQDNTAEQSTPSFDEQYAEVKFSDFDNKSDLLAGGSYDDSEPVPDETQEPLPDTAVTTADNAVYKTLNVGGREYKFNEPELEQMAMRGLYLGDMEARIKPYADIITAVENDPQLGTVLAQAIENYRNGVPIQTPTPDVNPDAEPEQGDDEDYDTYEKRLAQWREARTQRLVDARLNQMLQQKEMIAQQNRIASANRQIINCVNADPDRNSVLQVMMSPSFPAGLRQAVDNDGPTFMQVYDAIKRSLGRAPYFGAPDIFGLGNNIPQSQMRGNPVQTPYVEGARKAPQYQGAKGGVIGGIPDVKAMSDEEFRAWKNSLKLNEFK